MHIILSCICQCKDTNFKANHNPAKLVIFTCWVVFANAKILILKLITTNVKYISPISRCICQCKDTNFKANHNTVWVTNSRRCVVFANAKILILKLITTARCHALYSVCCICQCKDTNFKANHNHHTERIGRPGVVFANAKILILKLITTEEDFSNPKEVLYLPMQRY